jgi:hypothetical protein
MKKIIQNNLFKVVFCGVLITTLGVSFADDWVYQDPTFFGGGSEWTYQDPSTYQYNYGSYVNPTTDVVSTGCIGCGVFSGQEWTYQDPSTYQYNYNSYINPTTDVVSTGCVGCGTTFDQDWTYQDPSTYQYNYGSYVNPTTDVVSTGCVGCEEWYGPYTPPSTWNQSADCVGCNTYIPPTYTSTNCVGCDSYTTPTYTSTGCVGCDTYTTPTYTSTGCVGCGTYTTPTYTSTGYSTTGYSTAGYSTGYTTPGVSWTGYNSTGGTGYVINTNTTTAVPFYVCPNGTTVTYASQCTVSVSTCPSGYTLINGSCIPPQSQCPAGTTLVNGSCQYPTTCPAGTTRVNGACVAPTTCPAGSTLVNGTCISSTTCPAGATLVNGNCVAPTTCPTGTTLVNGTCQYPSQCPAGTTRINGVCQVTSIVCPAGTTLINGTCQINTTVCPTGSTLINGICQINSTQCPIGTTFVNGVCVGQGTTVCPNGSTLVNGVCQINTTVCPAGTSLVNGACQVNGIICPSGSTLINGACISTAPIYQTCWDGSRIPNTSVCPSQYKICNGASVPIYQNCPTITYPPYVPPQVIKFNNVVTSPVTQITTTSARCNGIGLIANNAQSTGWFEYGETANLGRQTSSAAIGSAATAPFSNLLTNLKPQTRYYCRAVMQNQYGIVKGEIVAFTTKSKAVTYVKPVTTVKKTTTTKTTKTNQVVCVDGSVINVGQSTATLLNAGQKLISLSIEKVSGNLSADQNVAYKLTYKNLSDASLSGVVIKVTVPQEVMFASSQSGTYDASTRTLTFTPGTLAPNSEATLSWTGKVNKDAQVGKTIVTTAYVAYTVPGTQTQDEVTAYITGAVTPDTGATVTGAKKVIGSGDRGFLPDSLVEWLALIAILFIIFILGRSVYASYQEGRHSH